MSFVHATSGDGQTSASVSVPTGVANDDVLVACCFARHSSSSTPAIDTPSGWTLVATATGADGSVYWRTSCFRKVASSESGSYTFEGTTNAYYVATVGAYRGIDTSAVVNVYSNDGYVTSGYALRAGSVTPTVSPTYLVFLGGWKNSFSTTVTPPTDFTERIDYSSSLRDSVTLADREYTTTDATGSIDGTISRTTVMKHAFLLALTVKPGVPTQATHHYHQRRAA